MARRIETQMEIADRQLRELAMTRWDDFKKLTGLDVTNFIICMGRAEGKSYNQISIATKVHKEKVRRVCRICPELA